MADLNLWKNWISSGTADKTLRMLYGESEAVIQRQRKRYLALLERFTVRFPWHTDLEIFSTPGRTEVAGNHTDHNAGLVLAAAIDLDVLAVAARNDIGIVRVYSEGYSPIQVDVRSLDAIPEERFTSAAVVRGICAHLKMLGFEVGGFDAVVTSNVLKGSGLSSSAAYEVEMVTILNQLYNKGTIDPLLIAKIAQFAENTYFGKPCGLMDQTTVAVGGFVTIDFQDLEKPIVKKVNTAFTNSGYRLVVVDTGSNHADLNDEYAAVADEMRLVAQALGGDVLRDFSKERLMANIPLLRAHVNDRAILRAIHFFDDNRRVLEEVQALQQGDIPRFLDLIIESGNSSWMLCQNVYSAREWEQQGIAIGLAASRDLLEGCGAWRVHGGGFAGTLQAFVPERLIHGYVTYMRQIFGEDSCYVLYLRPTGTMKLEIMGGD